MRESYQGEQLPHWMMDDAWIDRWPHIAALFDAFVRSPEVDVNDYPGPLFSIALLLEQSGDVEVYERRVGPRRWRWTARLTDAGRKLIEFWKEKTAGAKPAASGRKESGNVPETGRPDNANT